jgi:hypothetical protein
MPNARSIFLADLNSLETAMSGEMRTFRQSTQNSRVFDLILRDLNPVLDPDGQATLVKLKEIHSFLVTQGILKERATIELYCGALNRMAAISEQPLVTDTLRRAAASPDAPPQIVELEALHLEAAEEPTRVSSKKRGLDDAEESLEELSDLLVFNPEDIDFSIFKKPPELKRSRNTDEAAAEAADDVADLLGAIYF